MTMYDVLKRATEDGSVTVAESFSIPGTEARYCSIPKYLFDSRVGLNLARSDFGRSGLWNHQAIALEKIGLGQNVVVSTGTASGKSLIFRAAVFHRILMQPNARVLVFYPLKALAADQLRGWRSMAEGLDIDPETVGRIDGSVGVKDRDAILEKARIVIMTPDVCHAWLMSRLSIPVVKKFLSKLAFVVLDEAHTLEGVFGSNFAFLLRRMLVARKVLVENQPDNSIQFIASTATIANPAEHLQTLTGLRFESIAEEEDGSPHAERYCAHIVAPPGEEMRLARELQTKLLTNTQEGGFITFIDSRKGVEVLAKTSQAELSKFVGDSAVMPYRAGYDSLDREGIERRLQAGSLRGVVSTSALELGIDLPHLLVGINIGVPATRKAYRQRLGRVGRSARGAFLVIAPQNAFRGYGTSFKEYHELSVEPSYLYLDNRFMQFAHGRCLADELEALGASSVLPTQMRWPEGFKEVYAAAKPGGNRPPEFDPIAQLGGDVPQRSFPLRNVGEVNFKIAQGEHADAFGEAGESQALRECYPGATYLHMGRAYEVIAWNTSAFQPFIKVKASSSGRSTRPRIKTWINAGIMPGDLMENHLLVGASGFIAECQMQITEKVEGYVDQNNVYYAYQDLRQRNPNMRPRQRNFRTSGVLLCIAADWFKARPIKQRLAEWMSSVFSREYSILPQDVGAAATNISVRSMDGGGIRGDCLVLFDQTYGSLRLTERLFLDFETIIQRLRVSAEAEALKEREELIGLVERLEDAYTDIAAQSGSGDLQMDQMGSVPGCLHAFQPGSVVCLREAGKLGTDVEVIQPTWMDNQLMYQVKCSPKYPGSAPIKRWVSAKALEPSANAGDWNYKLWNVELEEFVNEEEGECST